MPIVIDTTMDGGARKIVAKYEKLKQYRSTWDNHYKEVAEYVLPMKDDVYGASLTQGEKKNNKLFDSIGVLCGEELAGYLHGMLSNPTLYWFGFSTRDPRLDADPVVAKFLQYVQRTQNSIMNTSNFQPEIHEVYLDLACLGSSLLRVEQDDDDYVRYTSRAIYECVVSENHLGIIDTIYFEYKMTLDQLIDKYGDAVPVDYLDKRRSDPLQEVTVIQGVEPTHRMPEDSQHPMLPFTSVHVLKDRMVTLLVGGFEENPCIVSRFSKKSGEQLGRSPAMKALSDIKYANYVKKSSLEIDMYNANPAVQVPDDGVLLPVNIRPRATLMYKSGSKDRVEPLLLGGNSQVNDAKIEQLHEIIRRHFYLDKFRMVESDRMTATEVMQRRDEMLRSLSPITGRLQSELLAPVVMRTFNILMRKGVFGELPKALQGGKLEVRFTSQLSRAQDTVDGDNFMRAFGVVGQLAQINPQAVDVIDVDKVSRFAFKTYGAPLDLLKDDSEVKAKRQADAQAQAQAQQAQLAVADSTAQKNYAGAQNVGQA